MGRKEIRKMRKQSKRRNIVLVAIAVMIVLMIVLPMSYSKYVLELEEDNVQEAANFYFENNIANENEDTTYDLGSWNIEENYTVEFSMTNYENKLLYTDEDIIYTIETSVMNEEGEETDEISAIIYDDENNSITGNQTLEGGTYSENTYNLVISSSSAGEGEEFEVNLVLTSSTPYVKSFTTTFNLTAEESEKYSVSLSELEDEEYDILIITTYELDGDVEFTYDNSKYVLDVSDEILQGISVSTSGSTTTVLVPKGNLQNYNSYYVYLIKVA